MIHDYYLRENKEKEVELTKMGYTILRFEDDDGLNYMDLVAMLMKDYFDQFEDVCSSPLPLSANTQCSTQGGLYQQMDTLLF